MQVQRDLCLCYGLLLLTSLPCIYMKQMCKSTPTKTRCFQDRNLHLMCLDTNFTSIPDPGSLSGRFRAPPEKSYSLYLNDSCVRKVKEDDLAKYTHLTTLVLKGNRIRKLERNSFASQKHLQKLDLSQNLIKSIKDGSFQGLVDLTELHLGHNKLESIFQETFKNLPNLTVLKMNENLLEKLPEKLFENLEKLEELDLSRNRIINFNKYHFTGLTNLRRIYLQHNHLTAFIDDWSYKNLVEIDLRNNSLRCLKKSVFDAPELQIIRLSGNSLKVPQASWFRKMYKNDGRQYFDQENSSITANNPWHCDCNIMSYQTFLLEELESNEFWSMTLDIECQSPLSMKGKRLRELAKENRNLIGIDGCELSRNVDNCEEDSTPSKSSPTSFKILSPTSTTLSSATTTLTTTTSTETLTKNKPLRHWISADDLRSLSEAVMDDLPQPQEVKQPERSNGANEGWTLGNTIIAVLSAVLLLVIIFSVFSFWHFRKVKKELKANHQNLATASVASTNTSSNNGHSRCDCTLQHSTSMQTFETSSNSLLTDTRRSVTSSNFQSTLNHSSRGRRRSRPYSWPCGDETQPKAVVASTHTRGDPEQTIPKQIYNYETARPAVPGCAHCKTNAHALQAPAWSVPSNHTYCSIPNHGGNYNGTSQPMVIPNLVTSPSYHACACGNFCRHPVEASNQAMPVNWHCPGPSHNTAINHCRYPSPPPSYHTPSVPGTYVPNVPCTT